MKKEELSEALVKWYYKNARQMPWRVIGGAHPNPYEVWISEIMLQQTTVQTVREYFVRWINRFPTVEKLAEADIEEVLLYWQGLGYYTRARKIHECAQILVQKYEGKLPQNRDELLKLPGIGPYSASSIAAFGFNLPETVVDGNVIRVIARLYGIEKAVSKDEIFKLAEPLTHQEKPADYASAIMDLGAVVCTPQNPSCLICPWQKDCIAFKKNLMDKIPVINKLEKKNITGFVHLIQNKNKEFYIQKRTEKGLLNGLYEFPWTKEEKPIFKADWKANGKPVKHTFTHFHLTLKPLFLTKDDIDLKSGFFVAQKDFDKYPFSTLMKKVIKLISD